MMLAMESMVDLVSQGACISTLGQNLYCKWGSLETEMKQILTSNVFIGDQHILKRRGRRRQDWVLKAA
jgi:hypothetical protein